MSLSSLVSYPLSAQVFIHHPCLMKLPVSYYHYAQCDATHVRSLLVLYCHYTFEQVHGRLVTFISQMREKEMEEEFNPQAFKLASMDNTIVLPPYSKIHAGKPPNIRHGVSHSVCRA